MSPLFVHCTSTWWPPAVMEMILMAWSTTQRLTGAFKPRVHSVVIPPQLPVDLTSQIPKTGLELKNQGWMKTDRWADDVTAFLPLGCRGKMIFFFFFLCFCLGHPLTDVFRTCIDVCVIQRLKSENSQEEDSVRSWSQAWGEPGLRSCFCVVAPVEKQDSPCSSKCSREESSREALKPLNSSKAFS